MSGSELPIYEFGEFRLDTAKRQLFRSGNSLPLTSKVFETLLHLVEHAGQLVAKDELIRAVWPDTVVEENNLNQNISALRRLLGENRGDNRYIVTIPGQGYRFVAAIRSPSAEAGAARVPAPWRCCLLSRSLRITGMKRWRWEWLTLSSPG